MTKDVSEVLNGTSLLQFFLVKQVVLRVHSPLSWKTGMGSKMKAP